MNLKECIHQSKDLPVINQELIYQDILINSHLFLGFSLLSVLLTIHCNDFCAEFQKNGNKIDYGYEHNENENSSLHVIIGHKYWNVYTSGNKPNLTLEMETQSETSEWFGNEYLFAISHFSKTDDRGEEVRTGLIRVNIL